MYVLVGFYLFVCLIYFLWNFWKDSISLFSTISFCNKTKFISTENLSLDSHFWNDGLWNLAHTHDFGTTREGG